MYSWILRLAEANGFDGTDTFPARLFSHAFIHPTTSSNITLPHYDCHDDMSAFLFSLGISADQLPALYLKSNIFGCVAPFYYSVKQMNYIIRALYPNDMGFQTLINRYHSTLISKVKICSECAKEDAQNYGYYYLHRKHQLPGVCCCEKHHIPLMQYTGSKGLELNVIDSYVSLDIKIMPAHIKYAAFAKSFLDADIQSDSMTTGRVMRQYLLDIGYKKPNRPKLIQKIQNDQYDMLFPKSIERFLNDGIASARGQSLDVVMSLAMLSYLFDDAAQFQQLLHYEDETIKDQFEQNLLNENCTLLSPYHNTLVAIRDNSNDIFFFSSPFAFNAGWRRPCDVRQKTESEMYADLVSNITDGDYTVLSDFTTTNADVEIRHNVCGRTMHMRAGSFLLSANRCECERSVTIERARQRLSQKTGNRFTLITYTKQWEDAEFSCNICGCHFHRDYNNFIAYPFCPNCRKKAKENKQLEQERMKLEKHSECHDKIAPTLYWQKNHDEEFFKKQLEAIYGDEYILESGFVNIRTPAIFRHTVCGNRISAIPAQILRGTSRCTCTQPIQGKDFADYVEQVSGGRYRVDLNHSANNRFDIYDSTDHSKKTIYKGRILLELARPTESHLLPGKRYPTKIKPWVYSQSNLTFNRCRQFFNEDDLFVTSDVQALCPELNERQIMTGIQINIRKGRFRTYAHSIYGFAKAEGDFDHTYVAIHLYCQRSGQMIGVPMKSTLTSWLSQKTNNDSTQYIMLSGTKQKIHIEKGSIKVYITYKDIDINNATFPQLVVWSYCQLDYQSANQYLQYVQKYLQKYDVLEENVLRDIEQYLPRKGWKHAQYILHLLYNKTDSKYLQTGSAEYGYSDYMPKEAKNYAVSDDLQNMFLNAVRQHFSANEEFTFKQMKSLGFTKSQITRAAVPLIQRDVIRRVAVGRYVLVDKHTEVPNKELTVPLHENELLQYYIDEYGIEQPIIPELVKYKEVSMLRIEANLQLLQKSGYTRCLARGVYVLKESSLTLDEALFLKYTQTHDGHHIGYISGDSFAYQQGIIAEKPEFTHLISNLRIGRQSRRALRIHRGDSFLLVKTPRCEVTDDNYKILPLLDMLLKDPDGQPTPYRELKHYADREHITYDMCVPYLPYYRNVVGIKLKKLYDKQNE